MDVSMQDSSQPNIEDHNVSQETQPVSQPPEPKRVEDDGDAWGYLVPLTSGLKPIPFQKSHPKITIGRRAGHDVHLPWRCISSEHAIIQWNGKENGECVATIQDLSMNGTFLQKEKIGKNNTRILADGNEIRFGPYRSEHTEADPEYLYLYRDLVSQKREIFKKYDLSIKLGEGSFADVYKALQKGTNKWVAVKVISRIMRFNMGGAQEAEAIQEINIGRSLRHPNVCEFMEFYENEDKSIDVVMEYLDGGDLNEFIKKHNGLTDWMCRHITYQICKAVVHIHSRKITHRDLKPANILLTLDNPPIVKVADFGMAKLVGEASALRTMVGTVAFMAPEIVLRHSNDPPYTNKVDSWSLGGIIFKMFTVETPYEPNLNGVQLRDIMEQKGRQGIRWDFLQENQNITADGRDFIDRLLAFRADERMALVLAENHPWMLHYRPTYEIPYPDDSETQELRRTESINTRGSAGSEPFPGGSVRASPGAVLMRAGTVDPYADGDDPYDSQPPMRTRALSLDPYDDGPQPHGSNRIPNQNPPARSRYAAQPLSDIEEGGSVPGLTRAQRNGQSRAPAPESEESSAYLYGNPDAVPEGVHLDTHAPAAEEAAVVESPPRAQKRSHAEMRGRNLLSGSLSSLSTLDDEEEPPRAPAPPPTKRGRREVKPPSRSRAQTKPPSRGRGRGTSLGPEGAGAGPATARAPRRPPPIAKPPSKTATGKGKGRATSAPAVEEMDVQPEEQGGPTTRKSARPTREARAKR